MRILILQPGIGSYRIDFFNALAECVTLKVVYFFDHSSGQTFTQSQSARLRGCEVEKLEGGFDVGEYPVRPMLGKVVDDFSPDIVVSHEYNTLTAQLWLHKLLLRRSWKLFVWTSDTAWMVDECRGLRRPARNFLSRRADAVMVYSQSVAEAYHRVVGLPMKKLTICPNVQSAERLRLDASAAMPRSLELYEKLRLPGKKVFLFVGRFHPVKNLPALFEAFAKAAPPDAVLLMVGSGELEDELKALRRKLAREDRIIMCGRAEGEELAAYYNLAAVLMLVSFNETFGAVINEALAIGARAILSARAGARGLIVSETQGRLVDPGNQDSIEMAIRIESEKISPAPPSMRPSLLPYDLPECVDAFRAFCERSLNRE